jgi:hypothetical protein
MAAKLRQIEKFVEIVGGLVNRMQHDQEAGTHEKPPLSVVDMGCGRGYLTFGVHSHLSEKYNVRTVGIESRQELIDETNSIAGALGGEFNQLRFVRGYLGGDISWEQESMKYLRSDEVNIQARSNHDDDGGHADDTGEDPGFTADVLIALHACDVATDEAIWSGIRSGAQIIVTAPCCQKEVRRQIDALYKGKAGPPSPSRNMLPPLSSSSIAEARIDRQSIEDSAIGSILGYGIYRERMTEIVTDTLRAMVLDMCGYDTHVFEFIGGEHTAKNVMITAVKRNRAVHHAAHLCAEDSATAKKRAKIMDLMSDFGVSQQTLVEKVRKYL